VDLKPFDFPQLAAWAWHKEDVCKDVYMHFGSHVKQKRSWIAAARLEHAVNVRYPSIRHTFFDSSAIKSSLQPAA
jgi:hypothetical protein